MWQLLNPKSTFHISPQVDRSRVWCSPMSGCQQTNSCTQLLSKTYCKLPIILKYCSLPLDNSNAQKIASIIYLGLSVSEVSSQLAVWCIPCLCTALLALAWTEVALHPSVLGTPATIWSNQVTALQTEHWDLNWWFGTIIPFCGMNSLASAAIRHGSGILKLLNKGHIGLQYKFICCILCGVVIFISEVQNVLRKIKPIVWDLEECPL